MNAIYSFPSEFSANYGWNLLHLLFGKGLWLHAGIVSIALVSVFPKWYDTLCRWERIPVCNSLSWCSHTMSFPVPPSNKWRNTGILPALNKTSRDRHLSWKHAKLFFPYQTCRGNSPFFLCVLAFQKNLSLIQKQLSIGTNPTLLKKKGLKKKHIWPVPSPSQNTALWGAP